MNRNSLRTNGRFFLKKFKIKMKKKFKDQNRILKQILRTKINFLQDKTCSREDLGHIYFRIMNYVFG